MHKITGTIGLNFFTGTGFIVSVIVAQAVLSAVAGVELSNSIRDLTAIARGEVMLFTLAFVSFAITGFLVWAWVRIRKAVAPKFGFHVEQPQSVPTNHKLAWILTYVGVGIATFVFFYGFEEAVKGIDPTAQINGVGQLFDAISTQNPIVIAGYVGMFIVLGFVVSGLGQLFHPIHRIADAITKGN